MNTKPKNYPLTRREVLLKGKEEPTLPDPGASVYLLDWLLALGPIYDNGVGLTVVPHSEIYYWAKNVGVRLEGPEAEWLYILSQTYANEFKRSSNTDVKSPMSRR